MKIRLLGAALALVCGVMAASGQNVRISEFMANNDRTLADPDGEFPDWIEIQNADAVPANLAGWYLTDDPLALDKWAFPSVTLQPGAFLVVFASGKNLTGAQTNLHTNFRLNADGGFLALVKPDGMNIVTAFAPYPATDEDEPFGTAEEPITLSLLANTLPQVLVPTNAAELASDWNQLSFATGANWFTGIAPPAVGFDTNQPAPAPSNLARSGTALQSTTFGGNGANLAINGILTDHTQTLNTDNDPFWQVTLPTEALIQRIVLRNRTTCCGSRLRDITVEILATNATTTNYTSALLNPENAGYTYPAGPALLELDLVALTGSAVPGGMVRVRRTPDPDLSGTSGQGTVDEPSVLSLGEVEVIAVPLPGAPSEVNLARTGTPLPTATQSSTLSTFAANLAINGNLGDFTHTTSADPNPTWTLNLGRRALVRSVTLHNRTSCCGSRLRDITVEVLASDTNTVLYTSGLLNPENTGFSYPNGPARLDVALPSPVVGQFVRVRRTPDPDLSGTGGQGNADEAAALSLGEVVVLGADVNAYRPFIRTDIETKMLGQNASAFLRLPFNIDEPGILSSLSLQVRYDDGFVAYLNGAEVARRNAPTVLAWNSAAPAQRDFATGIVPETIDLSGYLPLLAPGTNVLAVQGLNFGADDGDFLLQPDLIARYTKVTTNVFLYSATPGTNNQTDWYYDEVDDTSFSVDRGFFEAPFSLSITSGTPGAVIYYSFNSDEPGPGKGILYAGPVLITNTTVVRARAFKTNWKPTDVDTHTYIFIADVIRQAPNWPEAHVPPPYFPATWGGNSVDYGMDPEIVNRHTLDEWKEALTQIPTMSLVTEMPNLFDAATGIYANALQHGIDWERPASLELIDPNNAPVNRFQENCGLRIRGGFSRNPQFVKHSLRVFFRREYGAGRLRYPLFEDEGAQEFETFDLRTSQNYSWPRESSFANGSQDTMVREVFCRETLGAMGQPYRRSRYYHLYINGHYWGLYETDERPEASYGETYFGGDKENFDVVKCGNRGTTPNFATEATDGNLIAFSNLWTMTRSMVTNASNSNYFRIIGCNPDGTRNPSLPVMIDVDNLIDYMMGIFYTGDGDATLSSFLANNMPNNWFGMRDRTNPNVGFRFFNSDCEHTMGTPRSEVDRTGPWGGSNQGNFTFANPQWMHEELMLNAEYRLRFADHVQRHCFYDGAITPLAGTNRFLRKAAQITKAIRAYSARWGDVATTRPYQESDWKAAIDWVVTNWFPARTAILLGQLRTDSLFPATAAPEFSQRGGQVPTGFQLEMTNTSGAILFTTDGSDPRLVGGGVSPTARSYSGPIPITAPTTVRARVLIGSTWSALMEYVFFPPQDFSKLLITELMYHPPNVGPIDSDEYEFVELKNVGTNMLSLGGLRFNGMTYTFPANATLAPGQFYVLARNAARFAERYPGVPINGTYSGRLDNGGETIAISHVLGGRIVSVNYDDDAPWPITPDEFGFSLVPVQPNANPDPDNPANWRASTFPGGSPGADDPEPIVAPVLVNEVLSHSETGSDFIELFNPNPAAVDIGGWFLSDAAGAPAKYRIPDGTFIAALSYLVFDELDFNPTPGTNNSFSLNARGDDVFLFSGDANTNLTGYSHGFSFGAAPDGGTFGRYVISTGEEQFPAQIGATPGQANAGPLIGPVVINEIMYHPDPDGDEFVELKNISANTVPFFDTANPENTWQFNGLGFLFPQDVLLGPNELMLLVAIDPEVFRAKYSVPAQVQILGPYPGVLQGSGERLELQRPDVPDTNGVAYITVDEVRYNDKPPWPIAADGSGPSLQRKNSAAYGNDPANWEAAVATPGAEFVGGQSPSIDTQPQSQTILVGQSATFSVVASGPGPLTYRWRFNGSDIAGATSTTLTINNVNLTHAGSYSVVVFNAAGSAASSIATLTVRQPPIITAHPVQQFVRPGVTASFVVSATGNGFLRYQWQRNGTNIPGATSTNLSIPNAQFAHEGLYRVIVTDSVGPAISNPAQLLILVDPEIVEHPVSLSVVTGTTFTISARVTNTATLPLGYRLRRNNVNQPATHVELNSRTVFFTILAERPFTSYAIIATNAALTGGRLSRAAIVTLLDDSDGDGLPDNWETDYGPAAGERSGDADGDGASNWAEYIAGTDPTNALSYLKLELAIGSNLATVRFGALSNKTYTVQYTDNLNINPWLKLVDVPARGSNHVESVADPDWRPSRYYRLATPRQN
jgi:CotH protein/lamin tail-like protein/Ig-like domain-containing protein/F5/8 type C domain-containing protein/chitobiase/beta-hexosaminidase-like protein/thrombospondin type 3 repeat protein